MSGTESIKLNCCSCEKPSGLDAKAKLQDGTTLCEKCSHYYCGRCKEQETEPVPITVNCCACTKEVQGYSWDILFGKECDCGHFYGQKCCVDGVLEVGCSTEGEVRYSERGAVQYTKYDVIKKSDY
jgi:hypothetical protein